MRRGILAAVTAAAVLACFMPMPAGASDAGSIPALQAYLSGMTDQYSKAKFEELFIPKSWSVY